VLAAKRGKYPAAGNSYGFLKRETKAAISAVRKGASCTIP
jgi:hypothetical protein